MITFYKNVIIFSIGIFSGCHVTKNGGLFKIKNTKIKFESSEKQIFETDTTYHSNMLFHNLILTNCGNFIKKIPSRTKVMAILILIGNHLKTIV